MLTENKMRCSEPSELYLITKNQSKVLQSFSIDIKSVHVLFYSFTFVTLLFADLVSLSTIQAIAQIVMYKKLDYSCVWIPLFSEPCMSKGNLNLNKFEYFNRINIDFQKSNFKITALHK